MISDDLPVDQFFEFMNTRDLNKLEYPLEIDIPVADSSGFFKTTSAGAI